MFDRIIVISLRRRPDRLAAFRDRIAEAWPAGAARLTVFEAVDAHRCPPPEWWRGPAGAWGCYRSHQRIIEEALADELDRVIVFEDDATFAEGFEILLAGTMSALPADWGQLYLGGQHLRPAEAVNDVLVRGVNVNRTHAYAARGGERMRELYRHLHAGDHWRGKHHIDHHYGRLHSQRWPAYAPREWMCGQADGKSDISGRQDPERWWQR